MSEHSLKDVVREQIEELKYISTLADTQGDQEWIISEMDRRTIAVWQLLTAALQEERKDALVLVHTEQTGWGCPSGWNAWDADGVGYWLRFRWGVGTVMRAGVGVDVVAEFDTGDGLDGVIGLEEFCGRAGVVLG